MKALVGVSGTVVGMLFVIMLFCITCTEVPPAHVGVWYEAPVLFGDGGVDTTQIVRPGLRWHFRSTDLLTFVSVEWEHREEFDDAPTSDNFPVDLNVALEFDVDDDRAWEIPKNHGNWYGRKVKSPFRAFVMDFIVKYKMMEITVGRENLNKLEVEALAWINKYLIEKNIPIVCTRVTAGKAMPPTEVLAERARTAAQSQRKNTEKARKLAEDSRKEAETARAKADRAYMKEMKFTSAEYLKSLELGILRDKADNITWIHGAPFIPNRSIQ